LLSVLIKYKFMGFQKGNKNGITKGKSHTEGGIPMKVKSTGQMIEMEGGEGVINKKNMASSKTYKFNGKELNACEVASEINSDGGNGVTIDCDNITGKKYNMGGKTMINEDGTNIPKPLQEVFDDFDEDADPYKEMQRLRYKALDKGYDFDFGLDGSPTEFWQLRDSKGRYRAKKGYEGYEDLYGDELVTIFKEQDKEFNHGGSIHYLKSTRLGTGFYKVDYRGYTFYVEDVKGQVEGTLTWHIREDKEGEWWFTEKQEDSLWHTKGEALEVIERVVDREIDGYYDKGQEYNDGGKVEPTIEELRAREKKENEDFKNAWLRFKRNTAQSFGGTDYTPQESGKFVTEYEKSKNDNKSRRKFNTGGYLIEPHDVHVEFWSYYTATLYTMSGQVDGSVDFKAWKTYQLTILDVQKSQTIFMYGQDNYLRIPNEYFNIVGYNEKFVAGGEVKQYLNDENLSENDKEILMFLRKNKFLGDYSVSDCLFIENFKGDNIINSLTKDNLKKIIGMVFKDKAGGLQVKNIKFVNVGTGRILSLSPHASSYDPPFHFEVHKEPDCVDFQNKYEHIDMQICNTINYNLLSDETWVDNGMLSEINAIIRVCPYINPVTDALYSEIESESNRLSEHSINVGYAEFDNKKHYMNFIGEVMTNANNTNFVPKVYAINEGALNEFNVSLIYTYHS